MGLHTAHLGRTGEGGWGQTGRGGEARGGVRSCTPRAAGGTFQSCSADTVEPLDLQTLSQLAAGRGRLGPVLFPQETRQEPCRAYPFGDACGPFDISPGVSPRVSPLSSEPRPLPPPAQPAAHQSPVSVQMPRPQAASVLVNTVDPQTPPGGGCAVSPAPTVPRMGPTHSRCSVNEWPGPAFLTFPPVCRAFYLLKAQRPQRTTASPRGRADVRGAGVAGGGLASACVDLGTWLSESFSTGWGSASAVSITSPRTLGQGVDMLPRDQNRRVQRPGKGATEGRPTGWALQLSVEWAGPGGRCERVRGTPDPAGPGRARGLAQGAAVTAVPAKAVPRLCLAGWRRSKSAHRWDISGAPLPRRRFQSQARGPRVPSRRNRQKLRVLGRQAPENTAPRRVSGEPGVYRHGGGALAP